MHRRKHCLRRRTRIPLCLDIALPLSPASSPRPLPLLIPSDPRLSTIDVRASGSDKAHAPDFLTNAVFSQFKLTRGLPVRTNEMHKANKCLLQSIGIDVRTSGSDKSDAWDFQRNVYFPLSSSSFLVPLRLLAPLSARPFPFLSSSSSSFALPNAWWSPTSSLSPGTTYD